MERKYVEFRLGPSDISAVRFGVSPGYELLQAVRVLMRPRSAQLQQGWFRTVQKRTRSEEFRLLAVLCGVEGYMPDFLTSTPSYLMTPEEKLDRLRQVPSERLRFDLQNLALRSTGNRRHEIKALMSSPDSARRAIAHAWQSVWELLLAPFWPQMIRLLRADVALRARRNSGAGLAQMAATLHSTISWADEAVRVQTPSHEAIVDCNGHGLMLVPSVMMSTSICSVLTESPAQPTIFYPALGVSETWYKDGPDALDALTALLGQARAHLILELQQPLTTSECAALTGIASSTASHHLSVLRHADLVRSRREGVRVLHTRTPLGEALAEIQ